MKRQKLEITHPAKIEVQWYDKVCSPPQDKTYEGEIIGWRNSQIIVRLVEYGVLRFWKSTGLEVGNADHERRGFQINLEAFRNSTQPPAGVDIALELGETDGSMPIL